MFNSYDILQNIILAIITVAQNIQTRTAKVPTENLQGLITTPQWKELSNFGTLSLKLTMFGSVK
jgi:hypothetical protein